MSPFVTLFCTSLVYIGLRAFQQQNVTHEKYLWVPPVTLGMAAIEIITVTTIVKADTLTAALPMAAGGVLGCWAAMLAHSYLRRKKQ